MNWNAVNFDWNHIRAFLVSAEEGSFSAAARLLNTTQPTITRQITGLEENLGLALFERTVRGLVLTEAGQDLLAHAQAMAEAAALLSLSATSKSKTVSGHVSVTATDLMASAMLPSILKQINQAAPEIQLELIASNDLQNIIQREADIAIRHVRPENSELIGRLIGDFRANYYATTTYLEQKGRPKTQQDLIQHQFVGGSSIEQMLQLLANQGVTNVRNENYAVYSNSGSAMWAMAKSDMGITLLPEILGDSDPCLERVMADMPSIEFPVWLVTHRELRTTPRIRVVFDELARGLKQLGGSE